MKTKFLTALFILLILFIIHSANTGQLPTLFFRIHLIPYGDKIAHFLIMGVLALLVNLAMHGRTISIRGRNLLLGSVIVTTLVLLEEFSQIFLPHRTFSLADLTADFLGIFLFGRLDAYLSHRFMPVNQPNG